MSRVHSLSAAAGCAIAVGCVGSADSTWILTLEQNAEPAYQSDCSTNYDDANCVAAGEDTGLVTSQFYQEGPREFVAQVIELDNGEVGLIWDGGMLVGTEDGEAWTLSVSEAVDSEFVERGSGYRYTETETATLTNTLALSATDEPGVRTGSLVSNTDVSLVFEEDDIWDPAGPAPSYSSMPDYLIEYDSGSRPDNDDQEEDCKGSNCRITVDTNVFLSWTVTARRARLGEADELRFHGDDFSFELPTLY